MKKPLLAIALLLFSLQLHSQIVAIPDPVFKDALVNHFNLVIDTNGDDEIQVSEALAITELEIRGTGITDLTGLEAFQNLTSLQIDYVRANDLNVNTLTNLNWLWLSESTFENYPVNNLVNLQYLILFSTPVSNLNISNLTNLQVVSAHDSALPNLNLSNLSQLITLSCTNNTPFNIIPPIQNNIRILNIMDNQFTAFDFSPYTNVRKITCDGNPFNSLSFSNLAFLEEISCQNLTVPTIGFNNLPVLKKINALNGELSSIDLTNITSLQELLVGENNLTSLDLSANTALVALNCPFNLLTSLSLSHLTNLTLLGCNENPIPSIDFNGLGNLRSVSVGSTELNQLNNLSQLVNVTNFGISKSLFQTIDVSAMGELDTFGARETPLTSIDLSANPKVRSLYLMDNYSLEYLNCNNGNIISGITTGTSIVRRNPLLSKVCTDVRNIAQFTTVLTLPTFENNVTNPLVLSYCDFSLPSNYNLVSGNLRYDRDNNGCSTDELNVFDVKMRLSNSSGTLSTFTTGDSFYNLYVNTGNYTLTPQLEHPSYFNITPTSVPVSFANNNNNHFIQDFCITPNGVHNDLEVILLPFSNPAVGNIVGYNITFKNKGNQTHSGTVTFTFDGAMMQYSSADPTADSATSGTVSWSFSDLLPFETRTIYTYFLVNTPMSPTPVNVGDILNTAVTISPVAGDETPNDNTMSLSQTVVASYDPNDKICLEGTTIAPIQVGDYLHYVVRFQNTGTAPAQNVVIKDMIDTTKFDMNSLQITSSSHTNVVRINRNKVEFIFEGIDLAAESVDEPASHGYVAFKIKTINTLVVGDTAQNTADIYFDFNYPVVTNTASTTVTSLNVSEIETNTVTIFPIPVKESLQIKALENISSVELFDIQGRLLLVKKAESNEIALDFLGKTRGIYLLKVYTDKGLKTQKIIKE